MGRNTSAHKNLLLRYPKHHEIYHTVADTLSSVHEYLVVMGNVNIRVVTNGTSICPRLYWNKIKDIPHRDSEFFSNKHSLYDLEESSPCRYIRLVNKVLHEIAWGHRLSRRRSGRLYHVNTNRQCPHCRRIWDRDRDASWHMSTVASWV